MTGAFLAFAEAAEEVRESRGTKRKVARVARHLASVPDEALASAAVFWTGRPFPASDARTLHLGWATLREAALAVVPWDDLVWSACHQAVGDTGETLGKLLEAAPARTGGQRRLTMFDAEAPKGPFTLQDAAATYASLAKARTAPERRRIVEETWRRLAPLEAKFFTKIMTGGMRIGLSTSLVEDAIAAATERALDDVRLASMLTGDVGEAARLARAGRLADARFCMFHPLQFMLAATFDEDELAWSEWAVEDKFDGVRAQLHVAQGRATFYTRTLSEAGEFPELEAAARRLPGAFVLDGEVVAWRDGRAAPFGLLQRRLGRKDVADEVRREVPVRFVAYDVLYAGGEETWRRPYAERRSVLEGLRLAEPFAVSRSWQVADRAALERDFLAARERGNEGLVLKRLDSTYEFGKRGRRWLKLKTAFATLDVVVTAAEAGHGKRAGLLSDYTFAVRGDDGTFLNVGKAYTGLTDEEIRRMTARFRRITIERFGGVHLVRPEVVLEVAFDSVQESARHRSGFSLRFPRIVRLREDKPVEEIDTLERVRELARMSRGEVGGG